MGARSFIVRGKGNPEAFHRYVLKLWDTVNPKIFRFLFFVAGAAIGFLANKTLSSVNFPYFLLHYIIYYARLKVVSPFLSKNET